MKTTKTTAGRDELPSQAAERSNLNWDEMMLDYAAIEKRAQEMRAEAAWSIAAAVREWAAAKFGQRKAKSAAAARTRYQRRGQLT